MAIQCHALAAGPLASGAEIIGRLIALEGLRQGRVRVVHQRRFDQVHCGYSHRRHCQAYLVEMNVARDGGCRARRSAGLTQVVREWLGEYPRVLLSILAASLAAFHVAARVWQRRGAHGVQPRALRGRGSTIMRAAESDAGVSSTMVVTGTCRLV